MSERSESNTFDEVVDEMVEVACTWLNAGLSLGSAALEATSDGLEATARSLSKLADEFVGDETEA